MKPRILVVDDDLQILKQFHRILNGGGYEILTENSSRRALELLESGEPLDLLVLDLSMPEPDGFEILQRVRARRPELPILVTSGFLGGSLLKASESLGARASLNKLDAPRLLLEMVNGLLGR
jgi:CheY-like chemotaxis protein